MALFHSAPILLTPGSVILPGNYGRIIRAVGPQHPHHGRESVLERVRAESFQEKPSRLEAAFACTDEATARYYARHHGKGSTLAVVVYEVEKVDPNAAEHRADFNVVQPLSGHPADMEQIANLYWTAGLWVTIQEHPQLTCEELVTLSPLRIVRRLPD